MFVCFIFWIILHIIGADKAVFDCPMRQGALQFAHEIQPQLSIDQLQEIADGLNGDPGKVQQNCTVTPDTIQWNPKYPKTYKRQPPQWNDLSKLDYNHGDIFIYVDTNNGIDDNNNNGQDINFPLKSLQYAIKKSRQIIYRKNKFVRIVLITNFNNEHVDISGAQPINCNWKLFKSNSNGHNIYSCDLSPDKNITKIMGLRVNNQRAIRCRYPNANPETDGFGSTIEPEQYLPSTMPKVPDYQFNPDEPVRNYTPSGYYEYYMLGFGGPCELFDPPAGYWCAIGNQGGGAAMYTLPSGIKYNSTILPHTPYKDASSIVLHAWHYLHWSSWAFENNQYDPTKETFIFGRGGFQDGRGHNMGKEFYVENVMEELDNDLEWFFNESTRILYYQHNHTGYPNNISFEVTNLKILFSFIGNQTKPIKNMILRGVTLRDTQYTYLDNHSMPSGGDWGIERIGSVYIEGAENITIDSCLFTRIDGIAISINRYARNITINNNEFAWIGDEPITAYGDTEGITFENSPTTYGPDGTGGNQPRNLYITSNYVHETGIWQKRSGFYWQTKSCSNYIAKNIFFNGPRGGIQFNDGFGGGTKMIQNLFFDICREAGDHGPFDAWDRQIYTTKVYNGTVSVRKAWDELSQNFFINNYNVQESVDTDDGAAWVKAWNNFFVYGPNGLKSHWGHDIYHWNNIYAYVTETCFKSNENDYQYHDLINMFKNNTCINTGNIGNYGELDCNHAFPMLGNNTIYAKNPSKVGLCDMTEEKFQQKGYDKGTVIYNVDGLNDTQLLQSALKLLTSKQ